MLRYTAGLIGGWRGGIELNRRLPGAAACPPAGAIVAWRAGHFIGGRLRWKRTLSGAQRATSSGRRLRAER